MMTVPPSSAARTGERPSPDQKLKYGARYMDLETERGGDRRKPYFYTSAIEARLGRKVIYIKRVDNDSFVNPLRDRHGKIIQPLRYARTKKILEVTLGERVVPNSGPSIDTPPILPHIDNLYSRLCLARRQRNYADEEDCRRALRDRLPLLKKVGNDDTNMAANKVDQLLRYPVPRQFFPVQIARTSPTKRNDNNNLSLHLFCECGDILDEIDHVQPYPSSLSEQQPAFTDIDQSYAPRESRLHQTEHPGYKIADPLQFCQDFCSYILPVLRHIQRGAIKAGVIIPPLFPFDIRGWMPGIRTSANQSQRDPWKDTIGYVIRACNSTSSTMALNGLFDDGDDEEEPKPLDGADYTRFQAILRTMDEEGHFGNLIPVFSSRTGNLKWACNDHDETSACDRQLLDKFEEVTKTMEGVQLNCLKGELQFKVLADSSVMNEFYRALSTAPKIKKVTVQLTSRTTLHEYRRLRDSLSNANIAHITLNAAVNVSYDASWCNSILKLMANKRCQLLHLTGIEDFLDKFTGIDRDPSMQLKSLVLDCAFLISRHLSKLKTIMKLCPALKMLTLKASYSDRLVNAIRSSLTKLEHLQLIGQDYTTLYSIKQDKFDATIAVQAVASSLPSLEGSMYPMLKVLSFRCVDGLQSPLQGSLENLLRNCPRLSALDVQLPLEHFCSLISMLRELFRSLDPTNSASDLKRFLRLRPLDSTDHKVEMVIHWVGHNIGHDTSIDVQMTGPKTSNPHLARIFREYGSYIKVLVANHTLDDVIVWDLITSLQNHGSKMDNLIIDPSGLEDTGYIQTLLECCMSLTEFTLAFSCLDKLEHRTNKNDVLIAVGARATRLILHGQGRPYELALSRAALWEVRHLEIAYGDRMRLDDNSVKELMAVVRTPKPSATGANRNCAPSNRVVLPLQSFSLNDCELKLEDWAMVLTDLDLRSMQRLSFEDTNFGIEQLDLLIDQLKNLYARPKGARPLEEICIKNTDIVKAGRERVDYLESKLLVQVPNIRVIR